MADLEKLNLERSPYKGNFDQALEHHGIKKLLPNRYEIFQINIGKLCNMTCRHCHVDAGPHRTRENMNLETIQQCLTALDQLNIPTVDITGGAPELNPHFEYLVDQCVARKKHVMNRCNLTVLLIPKFKHLPSWFAERNMEIICSLPHYRQRNTDLQRGDGTFEKSIEALHRLNEAGYGKGNPRQKLTLVSNPVGAFLTGDQLSLEKEWKEGLKANHNITFDKLVLINNMPISRYCEWLEQSGNLQLYMETLVNAFNPQTLNNLMCRNTLSIGWDGKVYDCDFNQMLDLQSRYPNGDVIHISHINNEHLEHHSILTARHCFGCTAGAGSSCGGALT